ncbi:hypothetical protein JCM17092_20930 [Haloplanus litoreus]
MPDTADLYSSTDADFRATILKVLSTDVPSQALYSSGSTADIEFDFTRSVVPLAVIVAVATVALTAVMAPSTVFMMVLPSMIVFSIVAFFFGLKHGEFRASP